MDEENRNLIRAKRVATLEEKKRRLEEIRQRKAMEKINDNERKKTRAQSDKGLDDFIQGILNNTSNSMENELAMDYDSTRSGTLPDSQDSFAEKLSRLSTVSNIAEVHIHPVLLESFMKHTQTDPIIIPNSEIDKDEPTDEPISTGIVCDNAAINDTEVDVDDQHDTVKRISSEEKKLIMMSKEFGSFVSHASRVVERAMEQTNMYDIMIDYGGDEGDEVGQISVHGMLEEHTVLSDAMMTRERAITSLEISPFFPELFLVAYNLRKDYESGSNWMESSNVNTDGLVLLWSTMTPSRPEYTFTCTTPIMSACFNPFDRHMIIGASYSGQILFWDTRNSSSPVRRTLLSTKAHTHPIYSIEVVGTKNAHSLFSASTDGRVCVWNLEQLVQPTDTIDLRCSKLRSSISKLSIQESAREVPITSIAFRKSDANEVTVGSESGDIYRIKIHDTKDTDRRRESLSVRECVVTPLSSGHFGPITSMHYNPLYEIHNDSILLTSSIDWSCNIWSHKNPRNSVYTFEHSSDCVYDVRWCPVNPSVFATVDGSGKLCVWNVNTDIEEPIVECQVSGKAINRVRWSADGRRLLMGDSWGEAFVYDVSPDVITPRSDELNRLDSKLSSHNSIHSG